MSLTVTSLREVFEGLTRRDILLYGTILGATYCITVMILRLYFHPLSKFPGPTICAVSRLYEFYWDSIQQGRMWTRLGMLHEKYGPIIRIGPNELHIADADYFEHLFGFRKLNKRALTAKEFGLKYALFATEDHKTYVKKRAAVAPAFTRPRILELENMMWDQTEKASERVARQGKQGIDLAILYRAVTAEMITVYLFGQEYGYHDDDEKVRQLYDSSFDSFLGLMHLGRYLPFWLPMLLVFMRMLVKKMVGITETGFAMVAMMNFSQSLVQNLRSQYDDGTLEKRLDKPEHPIFFEDFINYKGLPDFEKRGAALNEHSQTLWSGGWSEGGYQLLCATHLVLAHPQVKARLQAELDAAWPDPRSRLGLQALRELPYLRAILQETLRLVPGALARLGRVNPTEVEMYKDWAIPPGTIINMSIPLMHHDPAIWGKDHNEFRPERWLEPGASERLDKYMVSFSAGTRKCPGYELGYAQMELVLAMMFRRFEITLTEDKSYKDSMPYHDLFTPAPKASFDRLMVKVVERA